MPTPTAIYDACVLYPAPLRDLLMRLAQTYLFHARWTDAIHDEWIEALLRSRPELAGRLSRTRELMNEAVRDCLVTDYEHPIPTLSLPDPKDRHVLAAAIHARAETIVTFNLKDFPTRILADYSIEAKHPDDFVVELLVRNEVAVCEAVRRQRQGLTIKPQSVDDLLATLVRVGLPNTVAWLRLFAELL